MSESYGLGLLELLDRAQSERRWTLRLADTSEEPGGWAERAACTGADPEAFFPEKYNTGHGARRVCAECPVRLDCLAESLVRDERWGIWGGLGSNERYRLRSAVAGEPLGVVRAYVEQDDVRRARERRSRRAKRRW